MFILTPFDSLWCVWFIYPVLCWFWCLEGGTFSVDWAQLSRLLPNDGDSTVTKMFQNKKQYDGMMSKKSIIVLNQFQI
jgi:hypothetical protein